MWKVEQCQKTRIHHFFWHLLQNILSLFSYIWSGAIDTLFIFFFSSFVNDFNRFLFSQFCRFHVEANQFGLIVKKEKHTEKIAISNYITIQMPKNNVLNFLLSIRPFDWLVPHFIYTVPFLHILSSVFLCFCSVQ